MHMQTITTSGIGNNGATDDNMNILWRSLFLLSVVLLVVVVTVLIVVVVVSPYAGFAI